MLRLLFSITALELFVGGGGRLTALGPVTLRMVLFSICVVVGWLAVFYPRARHIEGLRIALWLVFTYLAIHIAGIALGAAQGADVTDMVTELQQSMYWLAAPFAACVLGTIDRVAYAARLVGIAGLLLAGAYFSILLVLAFGQISFVGLYSALAANGEITSRGGDFLFYKGFVYLGIALVFFVSMRGRYWVAASLLIAVALLLTLTRGFFVSAALAILGVLVAQRRWNLVLAGVILISIAGYLAWTYLPSLDEGLSASRLISNEQRIEDMNFLASHFTIATLLFGHGFGSFINDRLNIENTFLWVLWNLGVVGLAFWVLPLYLCIYYFRKIPQARSNRLACAYMFGVVLIYIQTNTNPYLNNPIGLSFVIFAIFALRTMAGEFRIGELVHAAA